MLSEICLILQLCVGLLFLGSGVAKLRDFRGFSDGLARYSILPLEMVGPAAVLVVSTEILISISHLSGYFLDVMAPAAIVLLGAFLFAVVHALSRGDAVPCLCFGSGGSELISQRTIIRITSLIVTESSVWVLIRQRGAAVVPSEFGLESTVIGVAAAVLSLVVAMSLIDSPDLYHLYRASARKQACLQIGRVDRTGEDREKGS